MIGDGASEEITVANPSGGTNLLGGGSLHKTEDEAPFVLSEGLPAIPGVKNSKGGYVDMAELLRDIMELGRRGEEGSSKPPGEQYQIY